jgi:hypothetical protein
MATSKRPLRPAKTGEEHAGYYGSAPVKAEQGTGGLALSARPMGLPAPTPCRECPLRRDSAPGYLGGYTPEMYLKVMHGPASIACHSSPGFHEGDVGRQRHCTGVAAYRANVGHICQVIGHTTGAQSATEAIGPDRDTYFATPEEFTAHHAPGQVPKEGRP